MVLLHGQRRGYWQQHIDYNIQVRLNVEDNTFSGTQSIRYQNNSPDTLKHIVLFIFISMRLPQEV